MTTVLLSNARDGKRLARKALHAGDRWAYIGRDYLRLRLWERELRGAHRIETGAEFHELAQQLRQPFLQWLRQPGSAAADPAWWCSPLSETNTLRENLFQKLCGLALAKKLVQDHGGERFLLVVESEALIEQIAAWCGERGLKVQRAGVWGCWPGRLRFLTWFCAKWAYGLGTLALNLFLAWWTRPRVPPRRESGRLALVKTFVDKGYFEGLGKDRYWGPLLGRMREDGWDVRTIPGIYSIQRSRLSAYRWFRSRQDYFILPEDYYKLSDVAWAIGCIARQARLSPAVTVVASHDCRSLIREACWLGAADATNIQMALYARLALRLKEAGVTPQLFLNIFENVIPEKMLLWGFQHYLPATKTTGFQHILVPPRMLLQQYSAAGSEIAPQPDRIICNSELALDMLRAEGYHAKQLKVGASLRNLDLINKQPRCGAGRREVLVPLALGRSISAEVVDKILAALPAHEGVAIVIKPHPMMRGHHERVLGIRRLPAHARISELPLGELLKTAGCVAAAGTTALMEVAMAGIAPIIIGRETEINVSPFDGIEGAPAPVFTAAEIRAAVLHALARQEDFHKAPWLSAIRPRILSPLTDETIQAYCGKL